MNREFINIISMSQIERPFDSVAEEKKTHSSTVSYSLERKLSLDYIRLVINNSYLMRLSATNGCKIDRCKIWQDLNVAKGNCVIITGFCVIISKKMGYGVASIAWIYNHVNFHEFMHQFWYSRMRCLSGGRPFNWPFIQKQPNLIICSQLIK